MTSMTIARSATRNADISDLQAILADQQARKIDVIVPASKLSAKGGLIRLDSDEQIIDEDGITAVRGTYRPTAIFDEGISDKLGIPLAYVRKMRETRPDLYDANVNGLLRGKTITRTSGDVEVIHPADQRSFLLRCFRGDTDTLGVARAMLSNSYGIVDNFDYVVALLDGIKSANIQNPDITFDLTDRRMIVKVAVPELWALAPELLKGYRSPYTGKTGVDSKRIFAGLVASNSEVGDGAWMLTPRMTVEACTNGITMSRDAIRGVHLTGKQADGVVKWSADTQTKELAVVTAKTRDMVETFLNVDYVRDAIANLERKAGVELVDPQKTIEVVVKELKYSKAHTAGIFAHFIKGGQLTSGGVMQAITSYSQTLEDADAAFELDNGAVRAMEVAASHAR